MAVDLHYRSLSDIYRAIKRGEISSCDVVEHQIERIAAHEPRLKSFARVLAEQAYEDAARLDEARRSGKEYGLLHGVPITLKDVFFTEGVETASGTMVMAGYVPVEDATVVQRLRDAGAIMIGKTQLTEGATIAYHPGIEPPINPWNENYYTGVSSSGPAVAVAAGLAFGALATDTGGSIRFPAACCGLVGLKPTYGRISRHGVFPQADTLDHVGTLTRTVEDAARMLCVVAGYDPKDQTSLPEVPPNYLEGLPSDLKGVRVGIDWSYASDGVDASVVALLRQAVLLFEDLGAEVREVTVPPDYRILAAAWIETCGLECAVSHRDYYPAQAEQYGPVLASHIEAGLKVEKARYREIEQIRARFRADLDHLLQAVDIVMCPSMPYPPPSLVEVERIRGGDYARTSPLTFTAPFNFSGHPTLVLAIGIANAGMPETIQLVGSRLGEHQLLQAAFALENRVQFDKHPML